MPQLARWLTFIEQFDYEVVHRQGTKHGNADGLSRRPPDNEANAELRMVQTDEGDSSDFVGSVAAAAKTPNLKLQPTFRLPSNEAMRTYRVQTHKK